MTGKPYYYFVENEGYVRVMADQQNQPLPFAILKTRLAQKFSAFSLIKKDLALVTESLMLLNQGIIDKTIKQSLSFFSIITYGKCYAQAEGRGASINADLIKNAPQNIQDEHKRIIDHRNQYVAHGGGEGWEQNVVVASLNVDEKRYECIYPNIVFLIDIDSQLPNFLALVVIVDEYINTQLKQIFARLKEETKQTNFEDLIDKAIIPDNNDLTTF